LDPHDVLRHTGLVLARLAMVGAGQPLFKVPHPYLGPPEDNDDSGDEELEEFE